MTTSVVSIVSDRADHLVNLVVGLGRGDRLPDEVVVVDMGSSDEPRRALEGVGQGLELTWLDLPSAGRSTDLPLAAARNAGASVAQGDHLVFCDVDCIPGRDTIAAYDAAIGRGGLACGPVRYLERFWSADLDLDGPDLDEDLWARSAPDPARLSVEVEMCDYRHELFWSVAFGIDRSTWEDLGGFDERYVGYGGEDTDFGFTARRRGVPLRWMSDGTVYHQWHPVSSPPVEHLGSIVANSRRFYERWGRWPMEGWLSRFEQRGLVTWSPGSLELAASPGDVNIASRPAVVSIPSTHPYARKALPAEVDLKADPTDPWWPHPALEPSWIRENGDSIDVVHLHFGFEHRTVEEIDEWCAVLHRLGIGLVVTVHDIRNPHTVDNRVHELHLGSLISCADEVVTLTSSAAREVEHRWGRCPQVIPHPHMAPLDWAKRFTRASQPGQGPSVGVDFKVFRANCVEPEDLLAGLSSAVRQVGGSLVVRADATAPPGQLQRLASVTKHLGAALRVAPRPGDAALIREIGALDVAVLPYAFGTHSGLVELCHDLGTRVLMPDGGHYSDQWEDIERFRLRDDGRADPTSVCEGVMAALTRPLPEPADPEWRAAQRDRIRSDHLMIYRRLGPSRCR